jgi:hypothetical protein
MEVNIANIAEFDRALEPEVIASEISAAMEAHPGCPIFLLFTGEKSSGGKSWCPDCTRSEPIILTSLEEFCPDAVLLVFNVNREQYRKQDYTYRVNPSINLRCVPTLHR